MRSSLVSALSYDSYPYQKLIFSGLPFKKIQVLLTVRFKITKMWKILKKARICFKIRETIFSSPIAPFNVYPFLKGIKHIFPFFPIFPIPCHAFPYTYLFCQKQTKKTSNILFFSTQNVLSSKIMKRSHLFQFFQFPIVCPLLRTIEIFNKRKISLWFHYSLSHFCVCKAFLPKKCLKGKKDLFRDFHI